jgi:hypothetical protein
LETLTELVAKISTDATELKKGLSDAEGKTEQSSKRMAESLKQVSMAMAASGAAITAAMGLMGNAAINEEINIKKLSITLKNAGISYDGVKDSLEAVISATQRKTGIADSDQRDILSRLILITGDYNDSLALLPDVLNLSAIGEMDASTAATYLGKAFMDLKGGAEEVGVRFGQATVQFKDMAEIQTKLKGAAEAMANPFSVLKATLGDVAEEIGKSLVPTIKDFIDRVVNISLVITKWAGDNPELTRTLVLVTGAVGGVLLVVGSLGLAIPPIISGVKALITVFGAFKLVTLEYTIIALAAIAAIYGVINLVRSLKGEAYVGTSFGDTIFGQIKQDLASLMEKAKELFPAMTGVETSLDNANDAGQRLANTLDPKLVKAQQAVMDEADKLSERFADLMRQLQFNDSASGKLGLTMNDVYTAMYKLGYKTDEIKNVFERYGDVTEIDEALLAELGLTADDVARIVGRLKEETDKGTESLAKYGEAAKQANDEAAKALVSLGIAKSGVTTGGTTGIPISEKDFDAIYNARQAAVNAVMAKESISKEAALALVEPATYGAIAKYVEAVAKEAPQFVSPELTAAYGVGGGSVQTVNYPYAGEYATGGIVSGTGPQLATVHGGETIIPANESMGVTVNISGPLFMEREDQMNQLVDKIRKGIQRQDRLRFGGAYSG